MENRQSIFSAPPPPPLKTVKHFARPLLKGGNVLQPNSVWLKLQAPEVSPRPPPPPPTTFRREKQGAQAGLKILKVLKEQSRPSVSSVTSADVSLTTGLGWPRFWDVIG